MIAIITEIAKNIEIGSILKFFGDRVVYTVCGRAQIVTRVTMFCGRIQIVIRVAIVCKGTAIVVRVAILGDETENLIVAVILNRTIKMW